MSDTLDVQLEHLPSLRFDDVKELLIRQYEDIPYDMGCGLSPAELRGKVEEYLEANAEEARVIKKATVLNMVLSQAQIYVDTNDWFVDKINHGGLVNRLYREWYSEVAATTIKEAASWFRRTSELGIARGGLDIGHIAPGWDMLLERGLMGLSDDARLCRDRLGSDATGEQLQDNALTAPTPPMN